MTRMVTIPLALIVLGLGMAHPTTADPLRIVIDLHIDFSIDIGIGEPVPSTAAEPLGGTGNQIPSVGSSEQSADEQEKLLVAIRSCWNLGTLSSEAMRVTVVVGLSFSENGTPDAESIRLVSAQGGDDRAVKQVFDTARRALIRCGRDGYPMLPEKYEVGTELQLVFDPNGMRLR